MLADEMEPGSTEPAVLQQHCAGAQTAPRRRAAARTAVQCSTSRLWPIRARRVQRYVAPRAFKQSTQRNLVPGFPSRVSCITPQARRGVVSPAHQAPPTTPRTVNRPPTPRRRSDGAAPRPRTTLVYSYLKERVGQGEERFFRRPGPGSSCARSRGAAPLPRATRASSGPWPRAW